MKKWDFLFSVIGFAVNFGNVWRFSCFCYKNRAMNIINSALHYSKFDGDSCILVFAFSF